MLSTSSPFGERSRGNRWGVVVGAHLVGGALGGALVGGASGTIGWALERVVPRAAVMAAFIAVAIVGLIVDARVGGLTLPRSHRQVPERWRYEYRGWVYGSGYGFLLGLAFATIVPSSATYALFAGAAATGSIAAGVLIGAVFGVVRGVALLTTAGVNDPGALRELMARLQQRARGVDRGVRVVQGVVASGALMAVVR